MSGSHLRGTFRPAWWFKHHHLQTLWPQFTRHKPRPKYRREVLDLPDGDFLDIDWLGNQTEPNRLVVLIHGLSGNSRSPYIRGLATFLVDKGFTVAAMNLRGSTRANRRPVTYHSGHTTDIEAVCLALERRHAGIPLYAVGFSLSGNALLKWLGENPGYLPIKKAVAVSVPFDLENAADKLEVGFSRIYQKKLLETLKRAIKARKELFQGRINEEKAGNAQNFRAFDEEVTSVVNGFKNCKDYYRTCSSRQYLKHIETDTLIIHSKDDPFMSEDAIPGKEELGGKVTLDLTEHGGHVGFVLKNSLFRHDYWLEQRILAYIQDDGSHN